jgi:hypothetical protein
MTQVKVRYQSLSHVMHEEATQVLQLVPPCSPHLPALQRAFIAQQQATQAGQLTQQAPGCPAG